MAVPRVRRTIQAREDGALTDLRLGIGVLQDLPPRQLIEHAQRCEQLGYTDMWYANEWFYRDMFVGLTLIAQATQRMRVGTFVADPYTRHPALTAVAIATLDEVSNGRAMLLLASSGAGASPLGIPRVKPAKAIQEAIQLIRAVLKNEPVNFEGETVQFRNGKISFQAREDIPIYVAGRGKLVLRTAGAHADGVMVATQATPEGLRYAAEQALEGARRSGRSPESLTFFTRVDAVISENEKEALDVVRPAVARMLGSSYPDRSFLEPLGLELPPAFEEIAKQRNHPLTTANAHLVPDEVVRGFSWAGTAERVAKQVASVVDAGFENLVILPQPLPGRGITATVEAFPTEVLGRVRAELGHAA